MKSRLIWNPFARFVAFWLFIFTFLWLGSFLPPFGRGDFWGAVDDALGGDFNKVTRHAFAEAVALALALMGLALAAAYALAYVASIGIALGKLRRLFPDGRDGMLRFAENYDHIRAEIETHPLIGHAWKEFDETLVPRTEGQVISNTIRPQAFINISLAREKLPGLKVMSSIPGYFVGIGLLLTFAGLVLALNKAASAAGAGNAEVMKEETLGLLNTATFKFLTSIAGLGMSIVLSIVFKFYSIWIEGAFHRFCEAVERNLLYTAPQSISVEMNRNMAAQLNELKQINSADFFSRMGEQMAPQIHAAMEPMTASITRAADSLQSSSRDGISELIGQFSQSVQAGAGSELRELAETLKIMQASLLTAQQGIQGSGADFGRRLNDAAENLNRLVAEAGKGLNDGAESNRVALNDIVASLRETFDQANRKVEEALNTATEGVSERMERQLAQVFGRVNAQLGGFQNAIRDFQDGMGGHLAQTSEAVGQAQSAAVDAVARASQAAAAALRDGLAEALERMQADFMSFSRSLQDTSHSLTAQASALRDTTDQSRAAADAFGQTAQSVRASAAPLIQSSERIAGATERLSTIVQSAVASLDAGRTASQTLAETLQSHITTLSTTWDHYRDRFDKVDQDLAVAFEKLHTATEGQGDIIARQVRDVDEGFARAIDKLNPLLSGLSENTGELADAVGQLERVLKPSDAA